MSELIQVGGLCDVKSIDLSSSLAWTEISVPETLIIPDVKPDIEGVDAIDVAAQIIRTKAIVTPQSLIPNQEGKNLTGRKLIVEGLLCQTINYTANECTQSVHSAHFAVPFSAYIVIPKTIIINGQPVDSLDINFQVIPCIEDVFIKTITPRKIFKNVTLLLQAVPASKDFCSNEC